MNKSAIILSVLLLTVSSAHAGWTPPVRISDEAPSYEPRIVIERDNIHVVYWIWVGHSQSYYVRSTDAGNVWESPFHLGDTLISQGEDSPLIGNWGDTVVTIWQQNLPGGSQHNLGYRISTDAGGNWGPCIYILPTNNFEVQEHTFDITDQGVFLIYSYWDQEMIVNLIKSTNWGNTWSTPTEILRTQPTGYFDIAMRSDTIHFVWPGRFIIGDSWETYYIKSTNGGNSWSNILQLTTPDSIGSQDCCIIMNESGHLAVIWMDGKYSPNLPTGDLFVRYSYNAGEDWTAEEQLTFTHWAVRPRAVWQGDSIHIAWEDWRHSQVDIYYMLSSDNGISWGPEQTVENDPGMSLSPDLAIGNENIHVVWRQDTGMNGRGIYYSRLEQESAIGDTEENQLPEDFVLRAYPNPFNSKTIITYKNLKGGEIEIYNINAQKIRTFKTAGIKEG